MRGTWQTTRSFRIACSIYLLLFSILMWMVTVLGAPSFWYVPCVALLFLSSFLWINPSRGASFSLPPLLAFVVLLISARIWDWHDQRWTAILLTLALPVALGMCASVIRATGLAIVWSTSSVVLILLSFATDRLFTNKVKVRTVQMGYSLDGKAPWGDDTQRDAQGKPPVLVFVKTGEGYCYDAVFYKPLMEKLVASHTNEARVQYNVSSDFGKERSYNIRSIDGIMLNDENHEVVQHDGYGGIILVQEGNSGNYVPPNCPP